jgi:hypothetical protein
MKHVGKMKNNSAKIVVVYRTLPGDSKSALVLGTGNLNDSWHDSLMSLVQDISGQEANELADVLAVRKFPDGQTMLEALHRGGHLKKVPTAGVIMTPSAAASIPLDELNELIATQKGISVDDLAVTDGKRPNKKIAPKDDPTKTTSSSVNAGEEEVVVEESIKIDPVLVTAELSPTQMRSKADKLFKEAQALRKQADLADPPKSKKNKEVIADSK